MGWNPFARETPQQQVARLKGEIATLEARQRGLVAQMNSFMGQGLLTRAGSFAKEASAVQREIFAKVEEAARLTNRVMKLTRRAS